LEAIICLCYQGKIGTASGPGERRRLSGQAATGIRKVSAIVTVMVVGLSRVAVIVAVLMMAFRRRRDRFRAGAR
jgi:uncharacterized membrane protein YhaH (DUF805 family)